MTAAAQAAPPPLGHNGGPAITDFNPDDIKMSWIKLDIADFKRGIEYLDYEIRGYYITILVEMYDNKGKLPNDPVLLSKMLGTTRRVVSRVLRILVDQGKVYERGGWLRNQRCDEEREKLIAEYCRRHVAGVERERKKRIERNAASADAIPEVPAKQAPNLAETSLELPLMNNHQRHQFQENLAETIPNSSINSTEEPPQLWSSSDQSSDHKSEGELRTKKKEERKEKDKKGAVDAEVLPTPPTVSGREFWTKANNPGPSPSDHKVKLQDGKLELLNGFRAEWLERFGGNAERLDLAVMTAAAYVQPFGLKPLDVQVSAQLARHAAEKLDRDERHAATVTAGGGRRRAPNAQRAENDAQHIARVIEQGGRHTKEIKP